MQAQTLHSHCSGTAARMQHRRISTLVWKKARSRVAVAAQPKLSFPGFPGFSSAGTSRNAKKAELLDLIRPVQRGVIATDDDKAAIDKAACQLEKLNPTPNCLTSELLNGKWELLYTTSESILKSKNPPFLRPWGAIYQLLDNTTLTARNVETAPFFNQVFAELTPKSKNAVVVQFKQFKLFGLVPITAPPTARGELTITYLDDDLRVSRGDKGNLFVLRMVDRKAKP